MKNLLILIVIFCSISCKENKDSKIKNTEVNTHKSNVDFNSIELDYKKWWTYHYNTISLSSEFIALDDKSETISKNNFLEKLMSGDYIPLKLITTDSLRMYKLFKLDESADKGIRSTIKNTSAVTYKYFKMEGTNFPKFNVTDLNGKEYNNDSTLGKILIVKCWFINCKPCIAEFPELNELVEEYANREDVLFIALAMDTKADLDTFLTKKVLKYETIPNQEEFMEKTLDVNQYPTHLVVNQNGIIEKVVNKSSELISYLKEGQILNKKENKNLPPPPPPPPPAGPLK